MDYQTLTLEVRGGVAHLTLSRPEANNALDLEMARELMCAAIACGGDPRVRAVLLRGAGKMFCVGGDLKRFDDAGDQLSGFIVETTTYLHAAMSRFARMDAPVVAAVHGAAAGAGMSLVCAADLAIAGASSVFVMAYTAAGLVPDGSSSWYLPRVVGLRRAQELILTNRKLTAAEALEWGLVTRVVPDDELAAAAEALADRVADGPTSAFGHAKRLLFSSFQTGLETQMEHETQAIARAAAGADGREGVAAFVAKRAPRFTGE